MFRAKLHKLRPEAAQNCFTNSFGFSKAVLRRSRGSKKTMTSNCSTHKVWRKRNTKRAGNKERRTETRRCSRSTSQFAILRMDCWHLSSESTFCFYTPWTFLETTGTLWKQGARKNESTSRFRIFARLWESRLRVFLEYIGIMGSGVSELKRKQCISSKKKLKTLITSVWRLPEKQGLVRSDQETVFRTSPTSE